MKLLSLILIIIFYLFWSGLDAGPVVMPSVEMYHAVVEDLDDGSVRSIHGAYAQFLCELPFQSQTILPCPRRLVVHLPSYVFPFNLFWIDEAGKIRSAPDKAGTLKMELLDEDGMQKMQVRSEAQVQVQAFDLGRPIDGAFAISQHSQGAQLAVEIGPWSRSLSFFVDVIPPSIQIQQLVLPSSASDLLLVFEVRFSEKVFAVDPVKKVYCKAPLQPLSSEYGAYQLMEDSDAFCGEDYSQRELSSTVQVFGARSFQIHSPGPNRQNILLAEIHPYQHRKSRVTIQIPKGNVADYAGNINFEEAKLVVRHNPRIKSRKEGLETDAEQLSEERSSWRKLGIALFWCEIISNALLLILTSINCRASESRRLGYGLRFVDSMKEVICSSLLMQSIYVNGIYLQDHTSTEFVDFSEAFCWPFLDFQLKLGENPLPENKWLESYTEQLFWCTAVAVCIVLLGFIAVFCVLSSWNMVFLLFLRSKTPHILILLIQCPVLAATLLQFQSKRKKALLGVWILHSLLLPMCIWNGYMCSKPAKRSLSALCILSSKVQANLATLRRLLVANRVPKCETEDHKTVEMVPLNQPPERSNETLTFNIEFPAKPHQNLNIDFIGVLKILSIIGILGFTHTTRKHFFQLISVLVVSVLYCLYSVYFKSGKTFIMKLINFSQDLLELVFFMVIVCMEFSSWYILISIQTIRMILSIVNKMIDIKLKFSSFFSTF